MSNHSFFETLFENSKQVTPYLHGQLEPIAGDTLEQPIIHIGHSSSESISQLYQNLQQAHPEAGAPYWLTRTWSLLCWQPIYVAFVGIYSCRGLPKLSAMAQQVQPNFVSGYHFYSDEYIQGNEQDLITHAGKELTILFDYFRDEMSLWTRIRPGFTNHLFADGILGCLVRLSQLVSEFSGEYLLEQARLWLKACNLPEKLIDSVTYNEESKELVLVRTSCCLVYKCQGRKLCDNCPRHPKNK